MAIWIRLTSVTAFVVTLTAVAAAQDLPTSPVSLAGGRVVLGTDLSVSTTPH
jgi:hypothetical protein